jgi:hypothetical protein
MPLTDDQRAMLQLLLQRGQSYEDIASLLGLDIEQVRSRARAALTEIGGEDPDRDVSLTDYLLGQADPIGRADAARQLQSDGKARDLAERLATQLRVLAPGAELPELPGAASGATRPAKASAPEVEPSDEAAARRPLGGLATTLSRRQRSAIAGLVGGGIVILVVVLAVAGVFSGGDGDSTSGSNRGGSSQTASNEGPPRAELSAQDGSDAQGVAVFGRLRQVPVLQVTGFSLDPTPGGQSYAIWLRSANQLSVPLGRSKVTGTGRLQVRLQIPTQILQYVGDRTITEVEVSLVSNSAFKAEVRRARDRQRLPRFTGESILAGPIVGSGLSGTANDSGS